MGRKQRKRQRRHHPKTDAAEKKIQKKRKDKKPVFGMKEMQKALEETSGEKR